MRDGYNYRGWHITFSSSRPVTGRYVAARFGVTMSAAHKESIERMIDQKIKEDLASGWLKEEP